MNRKQRISKLEEKIKRPDVDPFVRQDMIEEATRLMHEENENTNIVEVTIRVDRTKGITLDHICAKCGAEAKSIPVGYDSMEYETGKVDSNVFVIRSAVPPKGWEHFQIQHASGNGTKHVEVCPECIRKFFRYLGEET